MAEIGIVSTTTVFACASQDESIHKKINLTSSDLNFLLIDSIQWGLLFPRPNSSSLLNLIRLLKVSLSHTLDFYFPLAGRFSITQYDDNTISFFINCNNAGVQFVHAVAENLAVSDVLQPLYIPPIFHSFFPLTQIKNYDCVSNPLLGVQITELSDGIFIGCSMNHAVADGSTFWNFMNSWSEISRGLNQISKPPVFENWLRNCCIKLPVSILNSNTSDEYTPPPLAERILHFSKETIAELKAKANSEAGVENGVVSSLQALSAHLWPAVVRSRQLEPDQDSKFTLYMGLRRRLKPEIPDGYFGNAVQGEIVKLKARQVIEKGIGFVGLQLNKLVSGYTREKAINNINSWNKDPKIPKRSEIARDALTISSSPRFDVYGNDFGWGKPIAVRSGPGNRYDGKMTVFTGLERGSIDIQVCVSPQVLQALVNDSEFMDAVSV